jgi:hypothetical protein
VVADSGGYRTPFELKLPSRFITSYGALLSGTLLHTCGLHEATRQEPQWYGPSLMAQHRCGLRGRVLDPPLLWERGGT